MKPPLTIKDIKDFAIRYCESNQWNNKDYPCELLGNYQQLFSVARVVRSEDREHYRDSFMGARLDTCITSLILTEVKDLEIPRLRTHSGKEYEIVSKDEPFPEPKRCDERDVVRNLPTPLAETYFPW